MDTNQNDQRSSHVDQNQLLAFVRVMTGGRTGREDDEHPLPPGPWDPVIRVALERSSVFTPHPEPWTVFGLGKRWRSSLEFAYGPLPEPWKAIFAVIAAKYPAIWDVIGGGPGFGAEVSLNPQPLPPRYAFLAALARTVTSRAELIQEVAAATRREVEQQGIIIVGGYINRFSDDFCGTDWRFKWPFPGPRPHWFAEKVSGIDLVVLAAHFDQAAKETFSQDLRNTLADASAKLAEAGLARM